MTEYSVIIPTLDEAELLARTLAETRRVLAGDTEIIVSDGGSRDRTVEIARQAGAKVLVGTACRGAQLNAGARCASGEILIFLHADTTLADDAPERIRDALRDPAALGGCCQFRLEPPAGSPGYRVLQWAVNARTRWFDTATGDQALFARRSAWTELGGFPDQPLFEDVVFARRLRRAGGFRIARTAARTSGRRWRRDGLLRTVATHLAFRLAYAAGVPASRLAKRYEGRTGVPAGPIRG